MSCVRSVTVTSMMFMMPMPPTSSDTAAMATRPRLTASEMRCTSTRYWSSDSTLKLLRLRWR